MIFLKKFSKLIIVLLIISLLFCACTDTVNVPNTNVPEDLYVHFIDVGQADCELITLNGHSMLIDGGNVDDGKDIVRYIRSLGIESLDYIFATHPHEDHIGGLDEVIDAFPVNVIYSPVDEYSGECFKYFKKAADKKCGITVCRGGISLSFSNAFIDVLWPYSPENEKETNNMSIVLKLIYGEASFLFTGDVEHDVESQLVKNGEDLSANVLKVGHHGSSSSTSYLFLRSVMPQFAVISCGKNNEYKHPHKETLDMLNQADVELYRTDQLGTVIISTDGMFITVKHGDTSVTEKAEHSSPALGSAITEVIGNKKSKKYHMPGCDALPSENNRVYFDSASDAENEGYSPCGNCCK